MKHAVSALFDDRTASTASTHALPVLHRMCCCRKRAGADVITAPAKGSTTQSKLAAQLEARKKGTALATSRPPAAGG